MSNSWNYHFEGELALPVAAIPVILRIQYNLDQYPHTFWRFMIINIHCIVILCNRNVSPLPAASTSGVPIEYNALKQFTCPILRFVRQKYCRVMLWGNIKSIVASETKAAYDCTSDWRCVKTQTYSVISISQFNINTSQIYCRITLVWPVQQINERKAWQQYRRFKNKGTDSDITFRNHFTCPACKRLNNFNPVEPKFSLTPLL